MSTTKPAAAPAQLPPETVTGMAISIAFWLCLIFAAGLFGVVALSPKYLIYLQLRSQFDANQVRLVSLESQADKLQKVIDAIRTDKDFASELTRVEFDAVRPGEELLPVESSLELDHNALTVTDTTTELRHEWHEPVVAFIAGDRNARITLLGAAAVLIIISFTILQPASTEHVNSGVRGANSVWRTLLSRYVRQV